MVFLLMGGAYLRSRIKQAGKWDQETIVSFFLCQYCSGEYLRVSSHSLYAWIKRYSQPEVRQQHDSSQQAEIRRLKAELRRVTDERDILKKAAAYFAKLSG